MVSIAEYENSLSKPLRKATLCILVKKGHVLLAMKKRGFGVGKWNGCGGKPKDGESVESAAIRETQEEIGVTPTSMKLAAKLDFFFPDVPIEKDWNQQVWVYLVDKWAGEPSESEEMKPDWFKIEDIPFDKMWPDDKHWLPKVLSGKYVDGKFSFGKDDKMIEFSLNEK